MPVASVAVIINREDRGGSVLLIRRVERDADPWSGQIGFPGGHRSLNDLTLLQTATREAEEEVGIKLANHEMLGALPLVTTRSRSVQVAPFLFAVDSAPTIRLNREVAGCFWAPLSELASLELERHVVHVEGGEIEVDSYQYQGNIIWGLTFRILNLVLGRKTDGDL
jgi:8-oxo-dGTP pyrophosphatase MutT (NUDIX family)